MLLSEIISLSITILKLVLCMYLKTNKIPPPNRLIGLPTTTDGVAPTITAVYETTGPANMISVGHYPKMGVGVIYET